jgi:hypothetical protein
MKTLNIFHSSLSRFFLLEALFFMLITLFLIDKALAQNPIVKDLNDSDNSEQFSAIAAKPQMLSFYQNNLLFVAWNYQNQHGGQVMISAYSKQGEQFTLLWTKPLPSSLEKLAGFTSDGQDYFCLTVKNEEIMLDPTESKYRNNVIRLVKIDKEGNELWMKDLNNKTYLTNPTFSPLAGGTGCLTYAKGFVMIVFAENTEWDANINSRHQTAAFLTVKSTDGTVVSPHEELSWRHSFDQRAIFDGKDFVLMDLGDDGYMPACGIALRKIAITETGTRMPDPMYFWSHGAYIYVRQGRGNYTYTSMGDIVVGENGYTVLFSSEPNNTMSLDEARDDWQEPVWEPRNLGLVHVVKNFETIQDGLDRNNKVVTNFQRHDDDSEVINITENMVDTRSKNPKALKSYDFNSAAYPNKSATQAGLVWLTSYTGSENFKSIERPKLVKLSSNQYLAMWEEWTFDKVREPQPKYTSTQAMLIDEYGNILKPAQNIAARLNRSGSDAVITIDNKATWLTIQNNEQALFLHTVDVNLNAKTMTLPLYANNMGSKVPTTEIVDRKFNRETEYDQDLDKAFDDGFEKMFHNSWSVTNAYPYIIEGNFSSPKVLNKIIYTPRQDMPNGTFLKGTLFRKEGGKYLKVTDFTFGEDMRIKNIDFEPTTFEGFKFEVTKAVSDYCSALEIQFFQK